ncbi:hypothetical protein B296_00029295 [Ensete ventricosum]|uniref:Receptor ligand binding region domain-containing protein n=1 Tax=Ensete ventricosum TaxID=4639 RepID=A0A426YXB4_ENSVE|nr:hypothetical protein B296_00029295 [Ensete ventricosum]
MESRIYVVHVNPDSGLKVFTIAKSRGTMATGYVWITSDWLASVLDSFDSPNPDTMDLIQGVIALRQHVPDSDVKQSFISRWSDMRRRGTTTTSSLNPYALYAYDSVWLVAHANVQFLKGGQTFNFSDDPKLQDANGSSLPLTAINYFNTGDKLLHELLLTKFTSLTGQVQFNSDGNLIHPAYDRYP